MPLITPSSEESMAHVVSTKEGSKNDTPSSASQLLIERALKRTPSQLARLSEMFNLGQDPHKAEARIEPTVADEEMESTPYLTAITTYLGYLVLILIGHLRDFFGKRLRPKDYEHLCEQNVL